MKSSACNPVIWAMTLALIIMIFHSSRSEAQEEWAICREDFQKLCESKLDDESGISSPDRANWEKQLKELKSTAPQPREISLPEAGIRDLCITCHLGIDDPLFSDAPEPFRTHPGKILEQHPGEKFGCTICHHGNGAGMTAGSAHGTEEGSPRPLIPQKYLQSTCIGCHETSYGLEGAEILEAGRLAFEKYACYACHSAPSYEKSQMFATPFQGLKDKIADRRWIISWLRDPQKMHPDTIMPNFKLPDGEIKDISAFLFSLEPKVEYPKADLSEASAEEGKKFFTELGCKACHTQAKDEPQFRRRVPKLIDAGLKLTVDWILLELKDPKSLNPDARIPKLDITEVDTNHIIAYLTTLKDNAEILEAETMTLDGASVENGKDLVERYGCYGCHQIDGFEEKPVPSMDVAETAKKTAQEISFGDSEIPRTKLDYIFHSIKTPRFNATEDTPLKAPEFKLDEGEAETLTTFYLNNYNHPLPERYQVAALKGRHAGQAGELIVTERNCRGCHMFEEDVKSRIDEFIEMKTYVPPRVVGEGEKVQPKWAAEYLKKPEPMRPWIKMRMPDFAFSDEQAQTMIEYFSVKADSPENARLPYTMPIKKEDIPQIQIDMGEYRLGFDKCMQCHPVSIDGGLPEDVELEDLSINLMLSKERLRFEWIKNFMKNPDKYAGTGTKMPYIYYSPEGGPKESDADMWIDYVATYLMIMEKAPEPIKEEETEEEETDWTNMGY